MLTRTHDGRAVQMLTILDEYNRECLKDSTSWRQIPALLERCLQHVPPFDIIAKTPSPTLRGSVRARFIALGYATSNNARHLTRRLHP